MIRRGYSMIFFSATVAIIGVYALGLGQLLPSTRIPFLDALVEDKHYKYLIPLWIPTTTAFVIANWVGWQYYQNS
ncbi:hypothetical protein M407DRAFT_78068 [Tulasnella calospora MUT 4182]|uniref:Uncharacterized protein n=1 Tax=Tulasnella calospora MUT 4182 TaxID=1051891 RepID=A0A0C3QEI2_9AGAM|nr:hypothetical protein M407DRAFT_78068 [Tulasnella calospora MUT 4182]